MKVYHVIRLLVLIVSLGSVPRHQTKSDELTQGSTSILHQWLRGIFTPALYESMIDLMIIPRKGREHAKALSMVMMHFTQSPRISNYAFMTYEHQAKQKKRPKCASLSAINHVLILLEHQIFFPLAFLLVCKRNAKFCSIQRLNYYLYIICEIAATKSLKAFSYICLVL